ncbi:WecB/TagA/CpsF family glycosyltransferase [Rivularia sp. UHCC 0363]|uniref:WecB/TagA/CpsF family glycosyltransferase n=1 Tax=Rivularia sp. UHCC 0363 TaxID=3110244 RepID=UPI002B1F6DC6|nr:WecB/TagA/CpsF family glycosyltransferase [Rivularia sp. UHCC 0363]MEA5598028.1 WecB/TagA/CpsF family glycosyltransferase [Rivularia sp. UHCC 0363]
MKRIKILNLEIDNWSKKELLDNLKSGVIFTPNVDHIIKLQRDSEFVRAYSIGDYKVCDSQILMYASKFLGTPIKEKISGSDLLPAFCNYHRNNEDIKIFLLGAAQGIANNAQKKINHRIGRMIVVNSYSPPFGFEQDEAECQKIVDIINSSDATVLVIGLGAPKQEKWLYKYKDSLKYIKIFMALGATIDFEAGNVKRAPKWMSEIGLEWLFRLLCEPKRLWKRYLLDDIPFLFLILKQKLNLYINKDMKDNQTFLIDKY